MPNPKRRHSRARQAKRRAANQLERVPLVRCSNCNAAIRPHHICGACGHYRGRQVIVGKMA